MKAERHPAYQDPAVRVAHLEEEGSDEEAGTKSEDPDGLDGVTEEFIVCLARAVKEAQKEKYCYHCSIKEHFICECPLMKSSGSTTHLNQKEGMVPEKGVWTLRSKWPSQRCLWRGCPRHRTSHTDSLLESQSLPPMVLGQKCSQGKD